MLLSIPDVLDASQVRQSRAALDRAEWVDGRVTAGFQSARARTMCKSRKGIRWRANAAT